MNPVAYIKSAVVLLAFAAGCAATPAAPTGTQSPAAHPAALEATDQVQTPDGTLVANLSNGLTVIVKATRSSPVVCVRAYVRAGGLYEREFLGCGLSHLTEHLVAQDAEHEGAAPKPGQALAKLRSRVTEIGGQSNASTSLEYTQYYISAAAGKTTDCIDLVADWMARPEISQADFDREHGIVQRELEMGRDDPGHQMWYAHSANVYGTHPAAVPVIGHQVPLARVTFQDMLAYHKRMYVPQNMVFCVVGDVDVPAVLKRTCQVFAGFERGRSADLSLPEVKPIAGLRRVVRPHASLKDTMQDMSFLSIPLVHEDLHALDVLAEILGGGQASRLVQKVQRKQQLVTSIACSSWTPAWGKGEFLISFRSAPDKADAAEKAILDELKAVLSGGVTADELARAKRQKIADLVYEQQTVDSIAGQLATDFLTTGDVTFSREYTRKIQAVTAEQVRNAARKYFTFDQMAVTRLVPKSASAAVTTGPAEGAKSAAVAFRLPNGLRVVLNPNDSVGLVSMVFATEGGLLLEDEKSSGLGSLMASLTTKGAGKLSAEQISEFFDQAGGGLSGACGNNSFYWRATVLDDSFDRALEILADVVQRPTFDANELETLRPVALAAIDHVEEQWQSQLQRFFRGRFFTNSPYRLLPSGSKDVVQAATVKQIADYHRKCVVAGSSALAVYGHFDAGKARGKVEQLFADLPKGKVELNIPPARQVDKAGELHILPTENKVAAIITAVPGMKIENLADRFPIDVLDTIISGYQLPSGWLHDELRGKQLVYVVHAYNMLGLAPGAFVTYAACQPEKAPEVVEIIKRNLLRASAYEPTQQEIDEAVNVILTAELLDNQSMQELAMQAALDELYGFGYEFRGKLESYYRKVRPADVLRVGRKYLGGGFVVTATTPKPELLRKAGEPRK